MRLKDKTAIVQKLQRDSVTLLGQAELRARFAQLGLDTVGSSPEALATIVKSDIAKWAKVIKDAGITAGD